MQNKIVKFIIGDTYSFINAHPHVMAHIRTLCRARPDGFQHMPLYRRGRWDGYINLLKGNNMPTGLLRMLSNDLRGRGETVVHSYNKSCSKTHLPYIEPNGLRGRIRDCLTGVTLRDYQIDATYELLCKSRGVAKMATNAGKTVIIAALLKFLKGGLVVVNSKDLLHQTSTRLAEYLDADVGMIGDSRFDYNPISVATIQTLASFHKKTGKMNFRYTFGNNRVLIIDECFVAGTMVGSVPIEQIVCGDVVDSYSESRDLYEGHSVIRTFKRNAPSKLYSIVAGSHSVVCTGNHPFLSDNGIWICAKDITVGDHIIYVEECNAETKATNEDIRMQLVRIGSTEDSKRESVQRVHCRDKEFVLLSGMQQCVQGDGVVENYGYNEQKVCVGEDEAKESDARREDCCQDGGSKEEIQYTLGTSSQGREWKTITSPAEAIVRSIGTGHRICCRFGRYIGRREEATKIANLLQNRHCRSTKHDRHRSGWSITQQQGETRAGQKEGVCTTAVRVDSIEIFEQGSDDRFAKVCPDGYVYNIEVAVNSTYVANGFIVHNCHHIAHNKSFDVLMDIPGWCRYGFSGTPIMRGNLNDLKLIAATGPVQVEVTNADLIDNGWSAVPTVYIHSISYKKLDATEFYDTSYQYAYTEGIVGNTVRHNLACEIVESIVLDGKSVLILVNRLAHGEALLEMLYDNHPDIQAIFVHGSSSVADRRAALDRLSSDNICVIATPIFDEGVDVPALDAVVLAGGGKSQWKLLQRLGRGLRRKEGDNVVQIHDFDDYFNKYLDRHCNERIRVYVREGFKTEVIDHEDGEGIE